MKNNFEIDVTKLVQKVKEQNLLFYPVIIHIFSKSLLASGFKNIVPAYINTYQPETKSVLFQDFNTSFELFFNQYVKNCFHNQSSNSSDDFCVLFSHLGSDHIDLSKIKTPVCFFNSLEQKNNNIYLSFYLSNLSPDKYFLSVVQDFCDSF